MANGKIIYTPAETKAINLTGANWLSLDSSVFNAGTGDLSMIALVYLSSSMIPDYQGNIPLVGKGLWNLYNNRRGWNFFISKSYSALGLRINDGQAAPNIFMTPENSLTWNDWNFLYCGVDRGGEVVAVINDTQLNPYCGLGEYGLGDIGLGGSKPPSDYAGSLDNDEPLRICGSSVSEDFFYYAPKFIGAVDFLGLDQGRCLPAAWAIRLYDYIQYGYPRNNGIFLSDFLALWDFNNGLLDSIIGAYELTFNGSGSPIYQSGWPYIAAPLEAQFTLNYRYEFGKSHADQRDYAYSLNHSLQCYEPEIWKQIVRLPFRAIGRNQEIALHAAALSPGTVKLYLESDFSPIMIGKILIPPEFLGMPYFNNGEYVREGELEFREA